jgi:hypothetical protein
VNLTSLEESDLTREPVDAVGPELTITMANEAISAHHEWGWILALVALAFIVFDVWYFTRGRPTAAIVGRPKAPHGGQAA